MHPAIAFKSIFSATLWCKYKVVVSVLIYYLGVCYSIIVIIVSIVTGGTHKLLVHHRDKIIVDIYILVHGTEVLRYTFVIYLICIYSLNYFSSFKWFCLVVIVRDGFCEIDG